MNATFEPSFLRVCLVGRPNVGKSTLFNRLAGKKLALVSATAGLTRDRKETRGHIADISFTVIDTAGLEQAKKETLSHRMSAQTLRAVEEADVVLFLWDCREGLTPSDLHFARRLRRLHKPVIVCANKAEAKKDIARLEEGFQLGFGESVALSATEGEGLAELYARLRPYADEKTPPQKRHRRPQEKKAPSSQPFEPQDEGAGAARQLVGLYEKEKIETFLQNAPDYKKNIRTPSLDAIQKLLEDDGLEGADLLHIAIVGRPNAGKSTLINGLIGQDRLLSGPEPGITRDSVAIPIRFKDHTVRLVDTAGLRKRRLIHNPDEKMAAAESLRSIGYAQVVALICDAVAGLEKQDLAIARYVLEEGRALIIVLNKWDLVGTAAQRLADIRALLEKNLAQAGDVTLLNLSAQSKKGLESFLPAALDVYRKWHSRISTGILNRWLAEKTARHPLPLLRRRRVKIRYITQVKTRPPTFMLSANMPEGLDLGYMRYLTNQMRRDFALEGVPLRFLLRASNKKKQTLS